LLETFLESCEAGSLEILARVVKILKDFDGEALERGSAWQRSNWVSGLTL